MGLMASITMGLTILCLSVWPAWAIPICLGRWPNAVVNSGGERILVALDNIDIPWYIRQGLDIFPGSGWRHPPGWREDPSWYDPMWKPTFSFESAMAAASVDVNDIYIMNTTLSVLDFREYTFMEPEVNEGLVQKYSKAVLISFPTPDITIRFGYEQYMYINYRGTKSILPGCNVYFYPKPNPTWMEPESATAQGGELLTIGGENMAGWKHTPQLVRVVADGVAIHVPVEKVDFATNVIRAPPWLLNETDIYVTAKLSLSLSGQTWHEVPVTLTYYDPSRIVCNEAVSITNYRALHFNEPHDTLVAMSSPIVYPSSGGGLIAHEDSRKNSCDASRFWLVREQHGAQPCVPGMPVKCGATIRLQNMVTHTNLRSQRAPSKIYRQQEASHYGSASVGSKVDDWEVMCEPATTHSYASDWKSFPYDKRVHRERFTFVLSNVDVMWKHSTIFRLRHIATNTFLNFADVGLPPDLCSECAQRQLSLVTSLRYDKAVDTIPFDVHITNQAPNCPVDTSMRSQTDTSFQHCVSNGHSKMDGKMTSGVRDGVRFYAKEHTQIGIESDLNTQVLLKRFLRQQRKFFAKDFVVWYSESQAPCQMKGKLMVGQLHEVYEPSRMVVAEPWVPFNGIYNETPRYVQTLGRINLTMGMERVYGPLVSLQMKNEATAREGSAVVQIMKEFLKEAQHVEKDDRAGLLAHLTSSTDQMYDETSLNTPIAETFTAGETF